MKFAAIDIGSNAVRLLVEEVFETNGDFHIHKVSLTRVPLRLGDEVFDQGSIPDFKVEQLAKTMKAFWYLMDVHNIEYFRACATSAMREAKNRKTVVTHIRNEANVNIEIIEGREEAELLFSNYSVQKIDKEKNYLYIDVGGGSTEVTLIKEGVREKSKSFKIGTVRMLKGKVNDDDWTMAKKWIQGLVKEEDELYGMGTGGNINRIHKECGKMTGRAISDMEIKQLRDYIAGHSMEDRIVKLRLKPDRADVIVPAAEIYLRFMKFAGITEMFVPKVGLSDGIILQLYNKWKEDRA